MSQIISQSVETIAKLSRLKILCLLDECPEEDIRTILHAAGYEAAFRTEKNLTHFVDSLSWEPNIILCDDSAKLSELEWMIHQLGERGSVSSLILLCTKAISSDHAIAFFRAGVKDIVSSTRLDELVLSVQRSLSSQQDSFEDQTRLDRIEQLEELWRLGQEAGKIAIWKWHAQEDRMEFSENFSPLFGLPRGQLTARGGVTLEQFAFLFHPSDMNLLVSKIKDCVKFKEPFTHEVRSVYPDHSLHWILIRGDVSVDRHGKVEGIHGIASNINERKRVQLALLDSEERFRSFMDNSKCVAFMKVRTGQYVYVNQTYREIISQSTEVIGKTDADLHPEIIYRALRDRDVQIWDSGETWSGIEEVPVANGELRHWWVVKFLFHNSAGEQFLGGWATDMTDRLKSEENARVLLDELAHAARLATVGQLVSELTHELNQPLYAIGNFTEACLNLLKEKDGNREDVYEWLNQIQSQVRRMDEIIRRSSGFSSKSKAELQKCELKELIQECVNLVSIRFRKEPVKIHFHIPDTIPTIFANALQLQQVFINLISNALESLQEIPAAEREINITVLQKSASTIVAQVEDSGPGINPEVLPRIFEPFFSTKSRGMGLGLPISKSIINSHGGELAVSPRFPQGVVFQILLPIQAKVMDYATIR